MNRKERRAAVASGEMVPVDTIKVNGVEISIHSPELDRFCDEDGTLVIPLGDHHMKIENWRDTVRQVPS